MVVVANTCTMSDYPGTDYLPDYASYNWTGPPANFEGLGTNAVGGDSSEWFEDGRYETSNSSKELRT